MTEKEVIELEQLAAQLKAAKQQENPWRSPSGIGDRVTGIQVVGPDGTIKQEWHDVQED